MRPLALLGLAWQSIRGHALRSSLTTLGVIIGVAAVIAFVTLGASLQAGIVGDISPDDGRNVYGWAAPEDSEGGPLEGAQPVFTPRDVAELEDRDAIAAAYGYTTLPTQAITYEGEQSPQRDGVIAAGPSYVREDSIAEGRQFRTGEREAVVNPAAAGLFEENVSVGDELTVTLLGGRETTVTVVGITESSAGLSPFEGFASSPRVYVPTDPYYAEFAGGSGAFGGGEGDVGGDGGGSTDGEGDDGDSDGADGGESEDGATGDARFVAVVVEAESSDDAAVDRAREAARDYLESGASDAGEAADEDFGFVLRTSAELLQQLEDVLDLLRNFVVGIAAISLLVGSIGIANIMLVSVTERTREIGIMKAVGAQNADVLGLFLTESVILGAVGAVLGTGLGLLGGYLGAEYVDLPLVYPLEYVALAVVVGVVVGVLAGVYPAWRAARTDPIDALRYE